MATTTPAPPPPEAPAAAAPGQPPVAWAHPAAVWETYSGTVLGWSVNLLAAIAILIGGLWISGTIRKFVRRRIENNTRLDRTFAGFLANLVYYVMIAFVLIAVLNRFGVQTTSLVAVLGAATLAIGLALQGTLGNVAAGVMLVLFRPYRIGDYVEVGGMGGTVKDIDIFTTELATPDNVKIVVPNGLCWGQPIRNFNHYPLRRCDITFNVAYDSDIETATRLILETVQADARFLAAPEAPWVRVVNLGASSVDLQLRAWIKKEDLWEARFATIRAVKEKFDAAGVEIPFPTQITIQKPAEAPA
jgi:small conductance mechanosensitive channel